VAFGPVFAVGIQALCVLLFAAGAVEILTQFLGAHAATRSAASGCIDFPDSGLIPAISVVSVVPGSLEQSQARVRRLLQLQFGDFEVVLVLQAPSDEELETWVREFGLQAAQDLPSPVSKIPLVQQVYESPSPIRLVVCRSGCGYADALNAGLSVAKAAWIALVEKETCFSQEALQRLIGPVLEDPEGILAVGTLGPVQGSRGRAAIPFGSHDRSAWLGRCAAFSFFKAYAPARSDLLLLNRAALEQVNGFGVDMADTLARLYRRARIVGLPQHITFLPESACRLRDSAGNEIPPAQPQDRTEVPDVSRRSAAWLIMRHGAFRSLLAPAFHYARVAPIIKVAGLAIGVAGFVAGWVPFPSLVLLLAATVVLDALLWMTSALIFDLVLEIEAESSDLATL
jgi:hypothetical protein